MGNIFHGYFLYRLPSVPSLSQNMIGALTKLVWQNTRTILGPAIRELDEDTVETTALSDGGDSYQTFS